MSVTFKAAGRRPLLDDGHCWTASWTLGGGGGDNLQFLVFKKKPFRSRGSHLKPLSFHQALEASGGPAGRIQDDLCQGRHLQRGVCPFCTVNQDRRPLPTHTPPTHTFTGLGDLEALPEGDLGVEQQSRTFPLLTCLYTGPPGRRWSGSP